MGNDLGDSRWPWQKEGRTGKNGPKYAKAADRKAVRKGKKPPPANGGGTGGDGKKKWWQW